MAIMAITTSNSMSVNPVRRGMMDPVGKHATDHEVETTTQAAASSPRMRLLQVKRSCCLDVGRNEKRRLRLRSEVLPLAPGGIFYCAAALGAGAGSMAVRHRRLQPSGVSRMRCKR